MGYSQVACTNTEITNDQIGTVAKSSGYIITNYGNVLTWLKKQFPNGYADADIAASVKGWSQCGWAHKSN